MIYHRCKLYDAKQLYRVQVRSNVAILYRGLYVTLFAQTSFTSNFSLNHSGKTETYMGIAVTAIVHEFPFVNKNSADSRMTVSWEMWICCSCSQLLLLIEQLVIPCMIPVFKSAVMYRYKFAYTGSANRMYTHDLYSSFVIGTYWIL